VAGAVAEDLQQHYQTSFEVVNAGVPGYVITQSAANLHHRVAARSSLVIYYEVNNDLALDAHAGDSAGAHQVD
jgi:hypothetical protein